MIVSNSRIMNRDAKPLRSLPARSAAIPNIVWEMEYSEPTTSDKYVYEPNGPTSIRLPPGKNLSSTCASSSRFRATITGHSRAAKKLMTSSGGNDMIHDQP